MIDLFIPEIIFEMMLSKLPRWFSRLIYPTTKIKSQVTIELRSNTPINISRTEIPSISIYFRIINHSLADLVLDRMLIGILVSSQPILYGSMLEQHKIPKRKTTDIYFTGLLTSLQEKVLQNRRNAKKMIETMNIDVVAYLDFKSEIIRIDGGNIYARNVECEL